MRLAILFFIGVLLIIIGLRQNLGSFLGAIIDPGSMVEGSG